MNIQNFGLMLAAGGIIIAMSGCSTATVGAASDELKFEEIQMPSLAIREKRTVVVRNANELTTLWKEGAASVPTPSINFSKYMIVGVFLGEYPVIERPQISFTSVERRSNPDRIEVAYKIKEYRPLFGNRFTIYSQGSVHKTLLIPRSEFPVQFVEIKEE